ncbi:DNA primase [Geodia barretti]|uniref:DNA primase n=1 Tax=Geodia barretti TaxID=519541 RepID=A0AA35SBQ5_GEOBA|nr:DNA primase [Geodia barretti]
MDLISLAQAGIQHVVATSGTALTEDHGRLLARFARQVVLLFDGDAAGSTAAMRALEVLLGTGLDARVVSLPAEHDPDTFVQAHGPEALIERAENAQSVLDFYLEQLAQQTRPLQHRGQDRAVETFKPLIAKLNKPQDAVRCDLLLREVAQRLAVDEQALRHELQASSVIAILLWATAVLGQVDAGVDRGDSRFMATVLARLAQRADPIANIYLNQARAEGLSSLLGNR